MNAILKMCYIASDKYRGVHFLAGASYGRFFWLGIALSITCVISSEGEILWISQPKKHWIPFGKKWYLYQDNIISEDVMNCFRWLKLGDTRNPSVCSFCARLRSVYVEEHYRNGKWVRRNKYRIKYIGKNCKVWYCCCLFYLQPLRSSSYSILTYRYDVMQ